MYIVNKTAILNIRVIAKLFKSIIPISEPTKSNIGFTNQDLHYYRIFGHKSFVCRIVY